LRKFFYYIAGVDLDPRIVWIVDALADLFNCVAVEDIKKEFLEANQDPYIHFYETFLAKYNSELREMRGVYYTPLPVVKFIVRAVDDILKSEFNIKAGLADHSKIKSADGFHRVQILDPAAGTGTFLAEVIEKIHSHFTGNKGAWQGYCADHLIPRINAFEILMAPYAMAHFKLDMTLKETGFHWDEGQNGENKRLHVYLTNTLEEAPEGVPELFMAQWLAREAEEARRVKRDVPIMVVMGNPPYNVSTQNKNDWIDGLITEYKKNLDERNIQPLSDDYIKFIRYGQYLIEKNANGILAYISNNSFIDGLIHRQMRKKLLECFDKIYIFDLHGNSMKRETALDGRSDGNVFDIQQGVSINIFIKTSEKTGLAKVYHCDLFGKREEKYHFLFERELSSIKWKEIKPEEPYYFFVPKNFSYRAKYEKGFAINALFPVYSSGVTTHDDNNLVSIKPFNNKNNYLYNYRPFDIRYINYDLKKVVRHRYSIMRHFLEAGNVGLIVSRQAATNNWSHIQVSNTIIDNRIHYSNRGISVLMPLYLYSEKGDLDKTDKRQLNLNNEMVQTIAQKTGLQFANKKTEDDKTFAPIDILDYIYAVLHSPAYRTKYKELLKIDFPRIPYPASADQFYHLATLGSVLRQLHLMEDVIPANDKATFPVAGSNEIATLKYEKGKVFINKTQYFDKVPLEAWEFYIGGYQPAQKWLKDRKGRTLIFDEIEHYRKIITVMSLTTDLQRQIDVEWPGEL
jgi:predicted helicase